MRRKGKETRRAPGHRGCQMFVFLTDAYCSNLRCGLVTCYQAITDGHAALGGLPPDTRRFATTRTRTSRNETMLQTALPCRLRFEHSDWKMTLWQ